MRDRSVDTQRPLHGARLRTVSEFVNHTVAALNKLLGALRDRDQTAARIMRLVAGRNGAINRKHLGHGHIASEYAGRIPSSIGHTQPLFQLPLPVRLRPRVTG